MMMILRRRVRSTVKMAHVETGKRIVHRYLDARVH